MSEPLVQLDLDSALVEADRELGNGRERAHCVAVRMAPEGKLWLRQFDQNEFLKLAWQEDDNTRHLTSAADSRTLGAIADHLLEEFGSFGDLVASDAIPGQLDPSWFQKCADLYKRFDWSEWTKPWLVAAQGSELRNSPDTKHYVCEGVHRTMVVAVGLLDGSIEWQPVIAIVADGRPHCC